LNERISEIVWQESLKQADNMVKYLHEQPNGETSDTIYGLRSIAINVLGEAGYGQPQKWSSTESETDVKGKLTYFDAISAIVNSLVPAAILPNWFLQLPFMPAFLRKVGKAKDEYPYHTTEMLEKERSLIASGVEDRNSMMAMLVRLSEQSGGDANGKSSSTQFLTPHEIQGNLFIFTIAGFDTTANTMAYAITLLAAYPEWQKWIFEELDHVFRETSQAEAVCYSTIFPRLTRCLALMVCLKHHYYRAL
jgi:cytochrome P450